ncbi:uncharacterized protein LOC141660610 [Apium graveolens]|uniref:uncharacterized protein LOC141660610 n=1 Tax=Apium graveolens TaxID=4045 RepID=UPI003D79D093
MVKRISASENEALLAEVTPEEVKEAAFSMHPDKAPGSDDLNPGFFQTYGNVVGRDVFLFCKDYMESGEILKQANQAVVRLIPKTKVPQNMTELRPISLCNVIIRILSKVLVNRLKPCLGSVISEMQRFECHDKEKCRQWAHRCTVVGGAPNISYLFFADDCYLFFRATEVEADNLKRILVRYEAISGQQINFGKSTVVFSPNTRMQDRTRVCAKLGVTEIDKPGKYLGMPMVIGRNRVAAFSFLLDKVEQKL